MATTKRYPDTMLTEQSASIAANALAMEWKRLLGLGKGPEAAGIAQDIKKLGFRVSEISDRPGYKLEKVSRKTSR